MEAFSLSIPPFDIKLETDIDTVMSSITVLYQQATDTCQDGNSFYDFHIRISSPTCIRKFLKPQAQFFIDGRTPFNPLPLSQAYPFFEWGLNWCIATHVYQYLLLHAAVVEKNNKALILPGQPGAGKSTLCAALVNSGWRLLSDEMAVIDPDTLELIPVVRPVSLKNESIDIIADLFPSVEIGQRFFDTAKGTVAHMKPPSESIRDNRLRSRINWIVFPQFYPERGKELRRKAKGETVLELAKNSFNYAVLGGKAFDMLCDMVEFSQCFTFEYGRLEEALMVFDSLANSHY